MAEGLTSTLDTLFTCRLGATVGVNHHHDWSPHFFYQGAGESGFVRNLTVEAYRHWWRHRTFWRQNARIGFPVWTWLEADVLSVFYGG